MNTQTQENQEAPKPRNLVEVAAERMGHKVNFSVIGRTFRAAKLSKDDVIAGLEGQDVETWFQEVTERAQDNIAREQIAGVGPRTFRELSDDEIRDKVSPKLHTLLDDYDGRNIVIIGPTGCGKSLTAFSLLRRARFESELRQLQNNVNWHYRLTGQDHERYVFGDGGEQLPYFDGWIRAHDLHTAVMRHPLGEGTPPVLRKAKEAPLLVIDDLQTAQKDDATIELLWHRYDEQLPTIATCGLTKAKCLERFGDAFGRRLKESGGEQGLFVDCFGGSRK